jgi:hypothetical protein
MAKLQYAWLLTAFFALCAFSTQPMEERQAQDKLPQSPHPMWQTLKKTKITVDQKKGLYNAKIPPEVKAFTGKEETVSGFMLPLESKDKFSHFLLSPRTPTCPYCPPGEPNEVIDVWTVSPIPYSEEMVTVKGTFQLMNDHEMGLFFKLKNAKIL